MRDRVFRFCIGRTFSPALAGLVILLLVAPARADVRAELQGKKCAVIFHVLKGDSAFARIAASLTEQVLRDNDIEILAADKAAELRSRWSDLENPDYVIVAEDFLREAEDYEIDVLVRGYLITEARPTLGGFWSAVAQATIALVDREARVVAGLTSASLGTPRFPPSDGVTETAAVGNAVRRAAADVCERAGFLIVNPPVPQRIGIRVDDRGTLNLEGEPTALAVHPLLPRCYVGSKDGGIAIYDTDEKQLVTQRAVASAAICWIGFSLDPSGVFAADDRGIVYEIGDDLDWTTEHPTDLKKPIAGDVSSDGRFIALLDKNGTAVIVDPLSRAVYRHALSGIKDVNGVRISPGGERMYVGYGKGCVEVEILDDLSAEVRRELVQTATGQVWTSAKLQDMSISPDGHMLAAAVLITDIDLLKNRRTDRVELRLIDLDEMRQFSTLQPKDYVGLREKDVSGVTFGPDWRFLAVSSKEGVVRIWNTETGQQEFILNAEGRDIRSLSFGANGRCLAAFLGSKAHVWQMSAGGE